MRRRLGLTWLALAGSALLVSAASCFTSSPIPECPTSPVPGLAIAVGARANSPEPRVPPEVVVLINQAIEDRSGITLVRVDGEPTIACARQFRSDAGNSGALRDDEQRFRTAVAATIAEVRAEQAEADPLAALAVAAGAAGPDGTVVLLDSGLQTVPPLDFRVPGLLDQALAASPQLVAERLHQAGALPDLTGRTVLLAGIGLTADPQPRLDPGRREELAGLWQGIVEAAGARSVTVLATISTDPAVGGVPDVTVVEVPPMGPLAFGCDTTVHLHDSGPVGFHPDSTELVDPAAARAALQELAAWLVANPSGQAEVTGYIAHYGVYEPDQGLALARARTIAAELVGLGAASGQVSATGGGWGPYPEPGAPPDPYHDPLNRRVDITLRCSSV